MAAEGLTPLPGPARPEAAYDLFVSYAEADRDWVEGYLFDALRAAGVAYLSEVGFALGAPRLLEFERAVLQSRRVLLVVSPSYLADGMAQFVEILTQTYGADTSTWRTIPLILHSVDLPPRLRGPQGLDASSPSRWAEAVERLCQELNKPVPGPAPIPDCPYPGMVPFRAEEAQFFCGREGQIQKMLEHVRHQHLLVVIGPSGSGKSSLVAAGFLPRLQHSSYFARGEWLVRGLRPGSQPMGALAQAIGPDLVDLERATATILEAHPPARRLLLVVDQFEELFTQTERAEQGRFITALQALLKLDNCVVVLALRADFYPELMESALWPVDSTQRLEIAPLHGAALREALVKPAEQLGVYLEVRLVERLLADAADEPGVLPLIQETMVLLWGRMQRHLVPLSAYEQLGSDGRSGLAVAMTTKADATRAQFTPDEQVLARRIFLRLVQFGEGRPDTRRQLPVSELRSSDDEPQMFEHVIRHLVNNRLLTLSGEEHGPERKADIAHEALIAGWRTLQGWVDERREAEQGRRRLEAKAAEWVRLGRQSGGLLDAAELPEAERWMGSSDAADVGYDAALPALLAASRAAQHEEVVRRRNTFRKQIVAVGTIVVLVFAVLAIGLKAAQQDAATQTQLAVTERSIANLEAAAAVEQQRLSSEAQTQRDQALQAARIATSRQLAAQAENQLNDRLDLALLFSRQAYLFADTVEARSSLQRSLEQSPSQPVITYLRGHTDEVHAVAFSPGGLILASGGRDMTVRLWDAASGQPKGPPLAGHTGQVTSVAFSPNGEVLASGSDDDTVRLWDVASGQPLGGPLIGHKYGVTSIAFSPDGKTLASGGNDDTVRLWDVPNRQPRGELPTGHGAAWSVAFSPGGNTLATGNNDKTVSLWDVSSRQPRGEPLVGHTAAVFSVVFSKDGRTLASSGFDGTVRLWDVATRQPTASPLTGHNGRVWSVAFSPDGKTLASGGDDRTVRLWDLTTGTLSAKPLESTEAVYSVAFSPDGQTLASASGDYSVRLWDVSTRQVLGAPLIGHTDPVNSVAFSPNGKIVASGSSDGTVRLWDPISRQSLGGPLTGHTNAVASVAFSMDGQTLASGSQDATVRLWDVATRQPLGQPLTGHEGTVNSVAFSSDGKILASGSADGTVRLWDATTRQGLGQPLTGHTEYVNSVAFSPDGLTLASGSRDSTVRLWDVASRQPRGRPLTGHTNSVQAVVFSPDGKLLASGGFDRTVRLWDVTTGQPVSSPLAGHTAIVEALAFSPDGRTLASGSRDSTVRLWDFASRRPLGAAITGHTDAVTSVAFSPDGKTLASASDDDTVWLWDVDLKSWLERACHIVKRNLSQAEWSEALGFDVPYQQTCPDLAPGL